MKRVVFMLGALIILSSTGMAIKDLMALQGSVNDLNGDPVYGNITVTIHDQLLGGTQIYNSGTDFYGNINNGQYDLMLGSGSNELELEFGKHYYVDLIINGEDIDFDGNERFRFQSSTGTIKNINLSGDNLSIMNGNVGIGTSGPSSKLEVVGIIHSTSGGFKFPDNTVQTTASSGGVPSGFCIFSATQSSCPAGWTKDTTYFVGRTIQGTSGTPGTAGGSSTHSHWKYGGSGSYGWGSTNPIYSGNTNAASSWPPYRTVLICCKN